MNSSAALHNEQPFFFESAGHDIYGILGSPASASNCREAVIFCAPAPHEMKKFHWAQRQMAQKLQTAGYHTLRFDYFASGDSSGDSRDFDLDQCRRNIQDAIRYMKTSGLVRRLSLVATRLGCPLALLATKEERCRKLILIDPVLDGAAYLNEAHSMQLAMLDEHLRAAPDYPRAALQGQLLGYPLRAYLAWQHEKLQTLPGAVKAKAITILSSQSTADVTSLETHLRQQIDDIHSIRVSDNLRWGCARALQFQDFPNHLLRVVVDSVRGSL